MREFIEHKAYKILKNSYPRVQLDYVILLSENIYNGLESHKANDSDAFFTNSYQYTLSDFLLSSAVS